MIPVNGHNGAAKVESTATVTAVSGSRRTREISKTGANGVHSINGSIKKESPIKLNGRKNGKEARRKQGSLQNGDGSGSGAEEAEHELMNGIEEIKISEMDVDNDSPPSEELGANGAAAATTAGINTIKNSEVEPANPFANKNFSVKTEGLESANGLSVPTVPVPPMIVQKCANKLLTCALDSSPHFPCKRCHRVFYCSEDHRQQHYNDHQLDCKTISRLEDIQDEEYHMWLRHAAPHLYDLCLNFILVWPSLTAQWLPDLDARDNVIRHQLLLGTMTNQEQNHLLICSIDVPSKTENNISEYKDKHCGTLYVTKRINHEAEVNRARYMPQDYNIVATKSSSTEVFIFDCSMYPEVPENTNFSPLLRMRGHQKEGFGLAWNIKDKGKLLSGSDDHLVCLWDINKNPSTDANNVKYVDAYRTFSAHEDVVEDVDWHPEHKHIFASVGDDKRLIIWDARTNSTQEQAAFVRSNAHERDINAVSFAPFSEFCLATGSSDHTVALWDMRNVSTKLYSLEYHKAEVMQVQWSPHCGNTLASTGKDNRVFVWDLAKLKVNSSADSMSQDDDPAPNELAFIHGGHLAHVNDIAWNFNDTGMIASVTEDNILQVWKIAENLQASYMGENDSDNDSADYMSEDFD